MTSSTALERRILLAGATNFRDLGGYVSADGRRVRWRRVFRADALHDLTADDVELLAGLGLADVFDLRTERELEVFPGTPYTERGVRHHHVPFVPEVRLNRNAGAEPAARPELDDHEGFAGFYLETLEEAKPTLRRVLSHLAEMQDAAVFHCTGGRDRTGLTAALLLSVLGVPRGVIAEDYALTTQYLAISADRRARLRQIYGDVIPEQPEDTPLVTHAEVMTITLQGLDDRYGSPLAYLEDAGLDAGQQDALRHSLLEDDEEPAGE